MLFHACDFRKPLKLKDATEGLKPPILKPRAIDFNRPLESRALNPKSLKPKTFQPEFRNLGIWAVGRLGFRVTFESAPKLDILSYLAF